MFRLLLLPLYLVLFCSTTEGVELCSRKTDSGECFILSNSYCTLTVTTSTNRSGSYIGPLSYHIQPLDGDTTLDACSSFPEPLALPPTEQRPSPTLLSYGRGLQAADSNESWQRPHTVHIELGNHQKGVVSSIEHRVPDGPSYRLTQRISLADHCALVREELLFENLGDRIIETRCATSLHLNDEIYTNAPPIKLNQLSIGWDFPAQTSIRIGSKQSWQSKNQVYFTSLSAPDLSRPTGFISAEATKQAVILRFAPTRVFPEETLFFSSVFLGGPFAKPTICGIAATSPNAPVQLTLPFPKGTTKIKYSIFTRDTGSLLSHTIELPAKTNNAVEN